jgi:molybdopterin-guanine dinucleotide biosynthesis protein
VKTVVGSVARNGDFVARPPVPEARPRELWATGDFVVCEMLDGGRPSFPVEALGGGYEDLVAGDRLIGALGVRAATLTLVGDWRGVGHDLILETLTQAGVLGRCSSVAVPAPPITELRYLGHASRDGEICTMHGVIEPVASKPLEAPVVLIIGTSMDAGKTVAAAAIVRELKAIGLRVAGAKLTGVGRNRDILAMREAGADLILDFVDAGLPSTVVPRADFEAALRILCSKLAAARPDVVVAEAGASPLEPYNGAPAIEMLGDRVAATVLCASDPYAVVGVIDAFGARPDLVSGRATSTSAGVELIEKLVGIPALNMFDPQAGARLRSFFGERLAASAAR